MANDFWAKYAQGGAAARTDSFTGLNDPFSQALMQMLSEAPADVQVGITSAFRSPETQERLWREALAKYGSEAEARKWVAPPGKSQHNHGNAADLKYLSDNAKDWVHSNADRYGLAFPLSNEDWHVELASARGKAPSNALGATSQGNALSASPMGSNGSPSSPSLPTREAPRWVGMIAPPQVQIAPLELPNMRRRA